MKINLDNNYQPRTIEAIAIRGIYGGRGNNNLSYQARTADGHWHSIIKAHNPALKIRIKKNDCTIRDGQLLRSEEYPV